MWTMECLTHSKFQSQLLVSLSVIILSPFPGCQIDAVSDSISKADSSLNPVAATELIVNALRCPGIQPSGEFQLLYDLY